MAENHERDAMSRTVFKTPIINTLCRALSTLLLKASGWRIEGEFPDTRKLVLIGAPHTSNWDFPLMLMVVFKLGKDVHWMGKHTLFPKPFGGLMRWLGGIAIDRRQANNTVEQMVEEFNRRDELIVVIPPEGTRSKVERWKTGFYHIANGAGVPILLGFIDGERKVVGFKTLYQPSGDLENDLAEIQGYYQGIKGIRAEAN